METAFRITTYRVPADKSVMVIGLVVSFAFKNPPPLSEYWYFCKSGYPPDESAKFTNNVVSDS